VAAISVLSDVQVTPEQLTWLMEQFKATKSPTATTSGRSSSAAAYGCRGVADGTDDIASMPPQILGPVPQWLGGPSSRRR
jgi:hypothetical protein